MLQFSCCMVHLRPGAYLGLCSALGVSTGHRFDATQYCTVAVHSIWAEPIYSVWSVANCIMQYYVNHNSVEWDTVLQNRALVTFRRDVCVKHRLLCPLCLASASTLLHSLLSQMYAFSFWNVSAKMRAN